MCATTSTGPTNEIEDARDDRNATLARRRGAGTRNGPIAQRLEQGTHNPLVPGSNPGGPTTSAIDLLASAQEPPLIHYAVPNAVGSPTKNELNLVEPADRAP